LVSSPHSTRRGLSSELRNAASGQSLHAQYELHGGNLKRLFADLYRKSTVLVSGTARALRPSSAAGGGECRYVRGDYATAERLLRPLAEQGNATPQSTSGALYNRGQGVPQDMPGFGGGIAKAADQGEARAQNGLGRPVLSTARALPQDFAAFR